MITPNTATVPEMPDNNLSAGAYVIRDKVTSTVIHIACPDVAVVTSSPISAHPRDEILHRDQQIWWVERLPVDTNDREGPVYSITNTASGLSLDVGGASTGQGASVSAFPGHGGYNQRWRLTKTVDEDDWIIVGVASGRELAFKAPKPESGNALHLWGLTPSMLRQRWEFLKPVVAVPAGWVEIINHGTGNLLSQNYLSSPPHLILQPEKRPELSSRHRETWGTQWTVVRPKSHRPQGDATGTWIIINRLTGSRIRHSVHRHGEKELSVVGVMTSCFTMVWSMERWIIELVDDGVWSLRNQGDMCYLQETDVSFEEGKELACVDKSFRGSEGTKMWSFRKVGDR